MNTEGDGTSGRRPIIIGLASLAVLLGLLWLSSSLGAGAAMADTSVSSVGDNEEKCLLPGIPCSMHSLNVIAIGEQGDQGMEKCFLAIPCWEHGGTGIGDQSMWEEQDEGAGALETQDKADWECWIAGGWYCSWTSSSATAIQGTETAEYASLQSTAAYPEPGSTQGFDADASFGGEEQMPTKCLLPGIPCAVMGEDSGMFGLQVQ